MRIHRLEPEVIDQIAAGEVLERPANLCKELVENSIDAGATRIEVFIEAGGRSLRVLDNGHGIEPDDLPLVFERHATSKIDKSSDLWKLGTFGFRGEAMASVAAVSRTKIITRTQDENVGHEITAEWGSISDVQPGGRETGTTVEVNDLFENVPARLKFLKSDGAETSQIKKVLKAMALAHPHVEFRFHLGGQMIFPSRENELLRAVDVLGVQAYEAAGELGGARARIFFASPDAPAKTAQNIWIFVNRRWIQDRALQTAVMESYRNLLMHGEYPQAVLLLEVPPEDVDVNVHPAKTQVKFADSSSMFRLVHRTLREGLEKAPWLPEILSQEPVLRVQPEPEEKTLFMNLETPTQFRQKDWTVRDQLEKLRPPPVHVEPTLNVLPTWSQLQVIGQANLTYIVAQSARAIIYVDQHAAHERVMFERLMDSWKKGQVESQQFLIPVSVEMDENHVHLILEREVELRKLGLTVERGGPSLLYISAAPSLIKDSALAGLMQKIGSEIEDLGTHFSVDKKISDLFASMACHSVVRAGQALSPEEMKALLNQMDEFPFSSFCPHGRPVFVEVPFRQLESDFGRIV